MPNPTRQEIIDAHEALSNLAAFASRYAEDMVEMNQTLDWNETIKAALPPKPQPTMAEVEWDNDKHRFAEAEHPDHGDVIMLNVSELSGKVRIFFNQYGEFYLGYASPENLTPTGLRYTLTEVETHAS